MNLEQLAHECYEQFLCDRKQHPSAQDIQQMLKEQYGLKIDDELAMRITIEILPSFYTRRFP